MLQSLPVLRHRDAATDFTAERWFEARTCTRHAGRLFHANGLSSWTAAQPGHLDLPSARLATCRDCRNQTDHRHEVRSGELVKTPPLSLLQSCFLPFPFGDFQGVWGEPARPLGNILMQFMQSNIFIKFTLMFNVLQKSACMSAELLILWIIIVHV